MVCPAGTTRVGATVTVPALVAAAHPYFGQFGRADWPGARTTMQRWFADPVVNTEGVDRGLGIIFTHDHYGPSTHQQIGLYATVLTQPAGSQWVHNETGSPLGCTTGNNPTKPTGGAINTAACRYDGGPTSWQAQILPPATAAVPSGVNVKPDTVVAFREFYLEFSDFQHAYEKGFYVGADDRGIPLPEGAPFPDSGIGEPGPNPRINRTRGVNLPDSFRVAINPPAREQTTPVFPDLSVEVVGGKIPGCPARPCPQAISVADPGMFAVNYRNEPVGLRIFDPAKAGPDGKLGMQADGIEGDLAFALASQLMDKSGGWNGSTRPAPIVRKIPDLNKTEAQLGFWTKTLTSPTATAGGDPFTPMIRTYIGDTIRVKVQAGGHEEEHNASISGMKWLQAGSGHGKAPNSGWRGSQAAGISEQFTLAIPVMPPGDSPTGGGTIKSRDYLYNVDSSMDGWWSGSWGIIRAYETTQADLKLMPNNAYPKAPRINNARDFKGVCPVVAPQRAINVVAILANDLIPAPAGVTIVPPDANLAKQHVGGPLVANGGTLVYNPRTTAIPQVTLPADGGGTITIGGHAGPLHDPTAIVLVRLEDLTPVDPKAGACKDSPGTPGVANAECKVKLKPGIKPEPLVLRSNAGDCVNLTVYNRMPVLAPDLPTLATLQGVVKRDRNGLEGSTTFNNNLIRPSSYVGVSPQLVALDPFIHLGVNVGGNIIQTVPPASVVNGKKKTNSNTYRWYAGDLAFPQLADSSVTVKATPVEFGGFGLTPADKIKQGQKSLVGGMVVVPKGARIDEDVGQHAQATITRTDGTTFRDLMLVMTKDVNHRYADGAAVEHMNAEGVGIPEDSQENSNMAVNYGIEPLWFRLGVAPNAPFGGAGCGPSCYGGVANAEQAYSNNLPRPDLGAGNPTGEPATPIFTAKAGDEVRIHSTVPHGTSRGTTWIFHGHVWQRDPYRCTGESRNGLDGACNMGTPGSPNVGSRDIGNNPMGFAMGAQESITPYSHFTFLFPRAGGGNKVTGDYLFRDVGSFGNASGLWGLLRVTP